MLPALFADHLGVKNRSNPADIAWHIVDINKMVKEKNINPCLCSSIGRAVINIVSPGAGSTPAAGFRHLKDDLDIYNILWRMGL